MIRVYTEDYEQTRVVVYLRKMNVPVFAIPNGGARSLTEGARFKRTGVSAGVPDLMVPVGRMGKFGLFLEIKKVRGSKTSDFQRHWVTVLNNEGYRAEIVKGFDEAKKVIDDYFKEQPYVHHIARSEIETEIPSFV